MTNPWAPKSAYDEADGPGVTRARRWHGGLWGLAFLVGMGAGYGLFEILDIGSPGARLFAWIYIGDPSPTGRFMARGILMVVCGGAFGELGSALWLYLCRFRFGVPAADAAAAMRRPVIPSVVLGRLYERFYGEGLR